MKLNNKLLKKSNFRVRDINFLGILINKYVD